MPNKAWLTDTILFGTNYQGMFFKCSSPKMLLGECYDWEPLAINSECAERKLRIQADVPVRSDSENINKNCKNNWVSNINTLPFGARVVIAFGNFWEVIFTELRRAPAPLHKKHQAQDEAENQRNHQVSLAIRNLQGLETTVEDTTISWHCHSYALSSKRQVLCSQLTFL